MSEDLQNLLDKIQKDGVDKAETEAKEIIDNAKKQATDIISKAEAKAKAALEKADKDGEAFTLRGEKALSQAARDVVLSVSEAINATMKSIASAEVGKAISGDSLKDIIGKVIEAYCSGDDGAQNIEVLVNSNDQKIVKDFLTSKFAEEMKKGLEIKSDEGIVSGFKVSLVENNIQHDFTNEAITEALCQLLRPHLASIVRDSQTS